MRKRDVGKRRRESGEKGERNETEGRKKRRGKE